MKFLHAGLTLAGFLMLSGRMGDIYGHGITCQYLRSQRSEISRITRLRHAQAEQL